MKISIIVPVYNCEKYLKKCILSILNQKYTNLEIILVNDGSTDNSGKICDYYAKQDQRVKVYHTKNSGASNARNFGLEKSTGDYICFIDSDDWIDKNMFKDAFEIIKKFDIDILKYSYKKECKILSIKNIYRLPLNSFIEKDEYKNKLFLKFFNTFDLSNVWGILFKKNLISSIRFNTNIQYGEDTLFFYQALSDSNDIYISNQYYYHYRLVGNGVIRQFNFAKVKKRIEDNLYVVDYISNDLINKYSNQKLINEYRENKIIDLKRQIALLLACDSKSIQEDCNKIMQLFGNDFFNNIEFSSKYLKRQKNIQKIKKIMYY